MLWLSLEEVFDIGKWSEDNLVDLETIRLDMEQTRARACEIYQDFHSANADSTTQQQLKEVANRLRYHIATREPFMPTGKTDLHVATLWGAKGITANHVYVLGLCDEAIPGKEREDYPGTPHEFREEQKRLFYVSITRAKKTLVLSRARYMWPGDVARLGLRPPNGNTLAMTQFLRDIMRFLPRYQNGQNWKGVLGSRN